MRPEAPGNRQLDTGFKEGRRPSERRACRGEGLGVRPVSSPIGRLEGSVCAERAWHLARAHLRVRGFGQGVFLRYSWVLHLGRQCTAKRRASRKAEVDQGQLTSGCGKDHLNEDKDTRDSYNRDRSL